MYELQSINNFILSPMGKGTSILPNRNLIIEDLERRLEKLDGIEKTVYYQSYTDNFFIHYVIPSETAREKTKYDVILQLMPPAKGVKLDTVSSYNVKFFSNCPSFVFTYAYVMNQNKMIADGFIKKYDRDILKNPPKTKNPAGVILYEKSIMFSCMDFIKSYPSMDHSELIKVSKPFDLKRLLSEIKDYDTILKEIDRENKDIRRTKADEAEELIKQSKHIDRKVRTTSIAKAVNSIIRPSKSTSSSKTNKRVNSSNSTSKTKTNRVLNGKKKTSR